MENMVGDNADASVSKLELSIETACEEFNKSVKLSLTYINEQLDDLLLKNCNELDELSVKIAARTNFLENNPSFLSCLLYSKECIKCDTILEFEEIKVTLKEHSKRILEKLDEIEKYHKKLLELVVDNGRDRDVIDRFVKARNTFSVNESEEDFHDCMEKLKEEFHLPKICTESEKIGDGQSENKTQIKSIKSFDKVTIQANAFSEKNLGPRESLKLFQDVAPEVERRKPLEDLHSKLVQQLVATDSLEGFLKLMHRKPKRNGKSSKATRESELENKYTGSLWFFHSKGMKKKSRKNTVSKKIPSRKSSKTASASGSTCCNLLVTSSQPCPLTNQERTKKIAQKLERNKDKLKCYDLLDDVDYNDVQPIRSEYPRRDNYPTHLKGAKSYLHRMMDENDRVWKKLIQPVEPKKQKELKEIKKKPLSATKAKQVKNLMEYLTSPQQRLLNHIPQTTIVMPVKVIYDNFPVKDNPDTPNVHKNVLITDLTKCPDCKVKSIENKKSVRSESNINVSVESKNEKKEDLTKCPDCTVKHLEDKKHVKTESAKSPEHNIKVPAVSVERKQEMLCHLKGLKKKNDHIQKNIQKAIDVIETKMIDLLSSPTEAKNKDAFNIMEKEITNVLTMMNDNKSQSKEEKETPKTKSYVGDKESDNIKIEVKAQPKEEPKTPKKNVSTKLGAEKEESVKITACPTITSPREHATTRVRKSMTIDLILDDGDNVTHLSRRKDKNVGEKEIVSNKIKELEKYTKKSIIDETNESKSNKENLIKKKEDRTNMRKRVGSLDRIGNSKKFIVDDVKKTANIEEGERLLGQVDNVIKKIDTIYTKFCDDGKIKLATKAEEHFPHFTDFFEVLKFKSESPPTLIDYKFYEQKLSYYNKAKIFHQRKMYYRARIKYPHIPPPSPPKNEIFWEAPKKEIENLNTKQKRKIKEIEPMNKIFSMEGNPTHITALKAMYTVVFTTIFFALNFDFAA